MATGRSKNDLKIHGALIRQYAHMAIGRGQNMATGRSQKARDTKADTRQQSATKQNAADQMPATIGNRCVRQALHK